LHFGIAVERANFEIGGQVTTGLIRELFSQLAAEYPLSLYLLLNDGRSVRIRSLHSASTVAQFGSLGDMAFQFTRRKSNTVSMNQGIKTVLYSAADITRAKVLFAKLLGIEPCVDSPYYVGFKIGDQDIGLTPNVQPGPTAFWHVSDIRSSLQLVLDAGGQTQQAVKDVGGGKLVATAKDAEGNIMGFIQAG
jgi:predicted enzyme related to lactoylglutathione lyase